MTDMQKQEVIYYTYFNCMLVDLRTLGEGIVLVHLYNHAGQPFRRLWTLKDLLLVLRKCIEFKLELVTRETIKVEFKEKRCKK